MAGCVLASAPLFLFVHTHVAIYCDLLLVLHSLAVQYFNSLVVTLAVCSIAIRCGNSLRRLPFGCWTVPSHVSCPLQTIRCNSLAALWQWFNQLQFTWKSSKILHWILQPKYCAKLCTEYCSQALQRILHNNVFSNLLNVKVNGQTPVHHLTGHSV